MTRLQKLGRNIAGRLGARSYSSLPRAPVTAPPTPTSTPVPLAEGLKVTAITFCLCSAFIYCIDLGGIRTLYKSQRAREKEVIKRSSKDVNLPAP